MSLVGNYNYRTAFIRKSSLGPVAVYDDLLRDEGFIDALRKKIIIFLKALKEYISNNEFNIEMEWEKFNAQGFSGVKKISKIVTAIYSSYESHILDLPESLPKERDLKLIVKDAQFNERMGQGYKTGSFVHFSHINHYIAPLYDDVILPPLYNLRDNNCTLHHNIDGYVIVTQNGIYLLDDKFRGRENPIIESYDIKNFMMLHGYL